MSLAPNMDTIEYYDSNQIIQGVGCKDVSSYNIWYCQVYSFNGTGGTGVERYYFYNSSVYNTSYATSKNICVKDEKSSIEKKVWHGTYGRRGINCDVYSSFTEAFNPTYFGDNDVITLTTNPVTYYKYSGDKTSLNIGYRPVVTILKKNR